MSDVSAAEPKRAEAIEWETTACPMCGEERSQVVFAGADLLYGCAGEFTLVRCDGCEHHFLNPRPTRAAIGQFYPSDYGPFRGVSDDDLQSRRTGTPARRVVERTGAATSRAIEETGKSARPTGSRASRLSPRSWRWLKRFVLWWIDSRAAPLPAVVAGGTGRALELGCAHGAYLEQLRQLGWNCIGVEPAADVAARAAAKGCDVRIGSLEEVVHQDRLNQNNKDGNDNSTFAPSSFDAVIAWMVVEHLHDPQATLKLVRELLVPGGRLLISVPNFGCWERSFFGRYWYALQLPTHLQHFSPVTLRRLLEASGLELVELIQQRNVNNLVGSVGLWLRTKFPRWSLGTRLIRWTDHPSAIGLCLLAPLSRCLALIGQAGRLTVVARKP